MFHLTENFYLFFIQISYAQSLSLWSHEYAKTNKEHTDVYSNVGYRY